MRGACWRCREVKDVALVSLAFWGFPEAKNPDGTKIQRGLCDPCYAAERDALVEQAREEAP